MHQSKFTSRIRREKHAQVKEGDIVEITQLFNYLIIYFCLFYLFIGLFIGVRLWYISLRLFVCLFVYLFISFFLFIYLFIYFCLFICYCTYCTKAIIRIKKSYRLCTVALSSPFVRSSPFLLLLLLFVPPRSFILLSCLFVFSFIMVKNLFFSPLLSLSLLSVHFSFDCFFICLFVICLIIYFFVYLFISLLVWSLCKKTLPHGIEPWTQRLTAARSTN